ncbi:hypothetical protein T4C_3385 [Trichinella pseudospiralis]|uniref:Uncharacterized protein n=1 Tax=Trichinella pseudospiralis TaxID=6337 RepID=A0A0V1GFT7_TRIPS|nr:hypothetical protein T4C_3385 [Trichinella pseudospiralis]
MSLHSFPIPTTEKMFQEGGVRDVRRKARRKLLIVWSGTSSKCMARTTIHVKRHM